MNDESVGGTFNSLEGNCHSAYVQSSAFQADGRGGLLRQASDYRPQPAVIEL